jgi:predicted GNAT family acetyltransferase
VEPLDNPVWHALCGPQATLAEGSGGARRYRHEYAPFAALGDAEDPAAWRALTGLVGTEGVALLLPETEPGVGWHLLRSFGVEQMVHDGDRRERLNPDVAVEVLDDADAQEMAALVAATEPGPWSDRTHELGEFVGVRVDGRIVAMAGQRMKLGDATEISAVCTDPAYRGRGLAQAVVATITERTRRAGRRPFLHVTTDNVAAIRVYEQLGFRTRVTMRPGVFRAPAA